LHGWFRTDAPLAKHQESISMFVTRLDPQTALIVVDLQQGIIGSQFIHPIAAGINQTRSLSEAFRHNELAVVLVNVAGRAPGRTEQSARLQTLPQGRIDLIPEVDPQPSDMLVTNRTWGAWASTDLESRLKQKGVIQVVITGMASGTGVESTARQAYELGSNVTLAIDALTDARPEAHAYSLMPVSPRLGETGSTHQILDLLAARSISK
jgi:nicotinamidase-related amidase